MVVVGGSIKVMIEYTTLKKTLDTRNTKINVIENGRRNTLAECNAKIEIYQKDQQIGIMNSTQVNYHKLYLSIVVCDEVKYKKKVTPEIIKDVERYEILTDVIKQDGNAETILFDNISQIDTDLEDEWKFEITDSHLIKKLINM